jgi:hypothetical protein
MFDYQSIQFQQNIRWSFICLSVNVYSFNSSLFIPSRPSLFFFYLFDVSFWYFLHRPTLLNHIRYIRFFISCLSYINDQRLPHQFCIYIAFLLCINIKLKMLNESITSKQTISILISITNLMPRWSIVNIQTGTITPLSWRCSSVLMNYWYPARSQRATATLNRLPNTYISLVLEKRFPHRGSYHHHRFIIEEKRQRKTIFFSIQANSKFT